MGEFSCSLSSSYSRRRQGFVPAICISILICQFFEGGFTRFVEKFRISSFHISPRFKLIILILVLVVIDRQSFFRNVCLPRGNGRLYAFRSTVLFRSIHIYNFKSLSSAGFAIDFIPDADHLVNISFFKSDNSGSLLTPTNCGIIEDTTLLTGKLFKNAKYS